MTPPRLGRVDRVAVFVVVVLLGVLAVRAGGTDAAFVASTVSPGSTFSSDEDWKPPLLDGAAVVKAEGGIPGFVRPGGSYTVLASVTDDPSSNPPAGVADVRGDVSALTAGATAVPLAAGGSNHGGRTWTHRSASLAVAASRTAGGYPGSVTAADAAAPANTSALALAATVDGTPPARRTATAANGGTAGRMDAGDTITYLWSEVVDPHSVLAGWGGGPVPVTVHATNNALLVGDVVTVRDAAGTRQLPLGTIATNLRDHVTEATTFGGPANPARSSMSWDAATGSITVRLGPPDTPGTTTAAAEGTSSAYDWTPEVVFDRAGNVSDTTTYNDPGGAGRGF